MGSSWEVALSTAVTEGVISDGQAAQLRTMEREASARGATSEVRAGFNWANVAYLLGAMLVLFAAGWILVSRWQDLGPWGVLGVSAFYAAVLGVADRRFATAGFPRAAAIALMLAVSLTPLIAWAVLALVGEMPRLGDELFRGTTYGVTRWILLDLSTILVALLVFRARPVALVTLPLAIATWWLGVHLALTVSADIRVDSYERWAFLACSLAILATADVVERWQRANTASRVRGDFAGSFWNVGGLGFAISYFLIWLQRDGAHRHLAPFLAIGMVVLGLVLGRRLMGAVGLVGVFAYLAYLANDVFKGALFPLALAGLGVTMIATTVWLQRQFPAIAKQLGVEKDRTGPLPWSRGMPWVLVTASIAVAFLGLSDAREQREQREFSQRLTILRMHSGSLPSGSGARRRSVSKQSFSDTVPRNTHPGRP